jgi:hypothetical protein
VPGRLRARSWHQPRRGSPAKRSGRPQNPRQVNRTQGRRSLPHQWFPAGPYRPLNETPLIDLLREGAANGPIIRSTEPNWRVCDAIRRLTAVPLPIFPSLTGPAEPGTAPDRAEIEDAGCSGRVSTDLLISP